jgi:glycosyltransferase involved in cell wall biosynthesis
MLGAEPNVHLLGARPYADVPAYLQHADVVLVPHRVTPFTESLDPIKAYECLALLTPTVATPVAGFRELADDVTIAAAESFVAAVRATLSAPPSGRPVRMLPSWADRARMFELVLVRANAPAARVTAA